VKDATEAVTNAAKPYTITMKRAIIPSGFFASDFAVSPNPRIGSFMSTPSFV
jgi:hypothetical protein